MAGKNGYTAKQFIDAMKGTGGVISTIASRVGCSWQTAKKYVTEYATVREVYEEECNRITDAARSVVITDIVTRQSVDTAKWWLRVKAPDEFEPRQKLEHTGKDGGPVAITMVEVVKDLFS